VDRGKYGSKIHPLTERTGLPLSIGISGANTHDSQVRYPWSRASRRSAPAADPAAEGLPNSTAPRPTTTVSFALSYGNDASSTASPAAASTKTGANCFRSGRLDPEQPGFFGVAIRSSTDRGPRSGPTPAHRRNLR
jgi:hypothetical protein